MLTWLELSKLPKGTRVRFAVPWDIFPETIVNAGEEGVIEEQGLNEIYQTVGILPDNPEIRAALKEWHDEILPYMTADDEWQGQTPLVAAA